MEDKYTLIDKQIIPTRNELYLIREQSDEGKFRIRILYKENDKLIKEIYEK